jgi:hypothetical protein
METYSRWMLGGVWMPKCKPKSTRRDRMTTNILAAIIMCVITNWGEPVRKDLVFTVYPVQYETTFTKTAMVIEQTKIVFEINGKKIEKVIRENPIKSITITGHKNEEGYWFTNGQYPVVETKH